MNITQKKLLYGIILKSLKSLDLPHDRYVEERNAMYDYLFGLGECGYLGNDRICSLTSEKCAHPVRQTSCSYYSAI